MSQEAEKTNGDLAQPDHGAASDTPADSPDQTSSGGDAASSPPESANAAAEDSNNGKRRRLSTTERRVATGETPDWLPAGWTVENRVRSSGATAGSFDKYYCDPVSGHVFRSRNEVLYYLKNGSKKKKGSSNNSSEGDKKGTTVSKKETTSNKKKKKSSGNSNIKNKKKPATASLKFDFMDIPKKVMWTVSDSAEGSWTPFMDDKKVAESVSREWKAAFMFLADKKN